MADHAPSSPNGDAVSSRIREWQDMMKKPMMTGVDVQGGNSRASTSSSASCASSSADSFHSAVTSAPQVQLPAAGAQKQAPQQVPQDQQHPSDPASGSDPSALAGKLREARAANKSLIAKLRERADVERRFRAEYVKLEARLQTAREETEGALEDSRRAKGECEIAKVESSRLEREISLQREKEKGLVRAADKSSRRAAEAEARLKALGGSTRSLVGSPSSDSDTSGSADADGDGSGSAVMDLVTQQRDALLDEVSQLQVKIRQHEAAEAELRIELAKLKSAPCEACDTKARRMLELEADSDALRSSMDKSIAALREELDHANTRCSGLVEELGSSIERAGEAEAKVVQAEIDARMAMEIISERVTELSSDLGDARSARDELLEELTSAGAHCVEQGQRIAELEEELESVKNQAAAAVTAADEYVKGKLLEAEQAGNDQAAALVEDLERKLALAAEEAEEKEKEWTKKWEDEKERSAEIVERAEAERAEAEEKAKERESDADAASAEGKSAAAPDIETCDVAVGGDDPLGDDAPDSPAPAEDADADDAGDGDGDGDGADLEAARARIAELEAELEESRAEVKAQRASKDSRAAMSLVSKGGGLMDKILGGAKAKGKGKGKVLGGAKKGAEDEGENVDPKPKRKAKKLFKVQKQVVAEDDECDSDGEAGGKNKRRDVLALPKFR